MNQTDAQTAASRAVENSKNFVGQQIDVQSTNLGKQISSKAGELRQIGSQMRESATVGGAADLADAGARYIERVGAYLQDADSDRLLHDLEAFSRERPWTIAVGALVLGLAASRVLKASSARRYREAYALPPDYASSASSASRAVDYGVFDEPDATRRSGGGTPSYE